jgi:hypothetical protein
MVKPEKEAVLGNINFHWLGTIISPSHLNDLSWLNTLKQFHITEIIIPPYHFSIQLNQLSHPEGEGTMFLQI